MYNYNNNAFVYITSNAPTHIVNDIINNGVQTNNPYKGLVLYLGVTANLYQRMIQHKSKSLDHAFSAQYNCDKLLFFQTMTDTKHAILKEKQLKKWHRNWKIKLITQFNPNWIDLTDSISTLL